MTALHEHFGPWTDVFMTDEWKETETETVNIISFAIV